MTRAERSRVGFISRLATADSTGVKSWRQRTTPVRWRAVRGAASGWTSGEDWLEQNFVKAWHPAIKDGTPLFVGEFGCYQGTVPHETYLAWLEDGLKVCKRHDWGWALWNIDGLFGILDTSRTDCIFEDFHGHKLDRKALDLLRKYK